MFYLVFLFLGKHPNGGKTRVPTIRFIVSRYTFNINARARFSVPNDKDRVIFNWFQTRMQFEFQNIRFFLIFFLLNPAQQFGITNFSETIFAERTERSYRVTTDSV